jgi:hypothetical protein
LPAQPSRLRLVLLHALAMRVADARLYCASAWPCSAACPYSRAAFASSSFALHVHHAEAELGARVPLLRSQFESQEPHLSSVRHDLDAVLRSGR